MLAGETDTSSSDKAEGAAYRVDLQPVLHVTYKDNEDTRAVGLRQVFKDAHLIRDLTELNPAGYVMWRRILTILAYRISGLDRDDAGVDSWRTRRSRFWAGGEFAPGAVDAYFDKWAHRMDLFDAERPWMQEASLRDQCSKAPLSKIVLGRPTGENGATWFSPYHSGEDRPVTIPVAVEGMLVRLGYAASGLVGSRTFPNGRVEKTGAMAPQRARISYLPVGPNLFDSLVASLTPPSITAERLASGEYCARTNAAPDLAEWEADPSDPCGSRPSPSGVISLLGAQAQHAILLVRSDADPELIASVYYAPRYLNRRNDDLEGVDPFHRFRWAKADTKGGRPRPERFEPDKSEPRTNSIRDGWRCLPSLLTTAAMGDEEKESGRAPLFVSELRYADSATTDWLKVAVCMWIQEPGKDKDLNMERSETPDIYPALWNEESDAFRSGIQEWAQVAEKEWSHLQRRLINAKVKAYRLSVKRDGELIRQWANAATLLYWDAVRDMFLEALEGKPGEEPPSVNAFVSDAAANARRHVRNDVVLKVYEAITSAHFGPNTAAAIVENRPRKLRAGEGCSSPNPGGTGKGEAGSPVDSGEGEGQ